VRVSVETDWPARYTLQSTCPFCSNLFLAKSEFVDRRPFVACDKGHTLCVDCLKERYKRRDRKCPTCGYGILKTPCVNKPLIDLIEIGASVTEISVKEIEMEKEPFACGTFGQVYSAKWRQEHVIIKVIMAQKLDFKYEANLTFCLNHANIIKLFGVTYVKHNKLGIVMEKAVHGSLGVWIGKINNHEKLTKIALGIVDGLQYVHSQNVIHRDIKPKNILMFGPADDMIPKIADFGMSAMTQTGLRGALYVAPEVRLRFEYDFAADVYSLAMMLFEMFNEQLITEASEEVKRFILDVHKGKIGRFPTSCKVPVYLRSVISGGWDSNPTKRPTLVVYQSTLRGKCVHCLLKYLTEMHTVMCEKLASTSSALMIC